MIILTRLRLVSNAFRAQAACVSRFYHKIPRFAPENSIYNTIYYTIQYIYIQFNIYIQYNVLNMQYNVVNKLRMWRWQQGVQCSEFRCGGAQRQRAPAEHTPRDPPIPRRWRQVHSNYQKHTPMIYSNY